MSVTEYSKILEDSQLSFDGNNISAFCKNMLEGLLDKNINKRLSYDQAMYHTWIIGIKDKIEDICSKYQSDPEKMVSVLNNTTNKDTSNITNYFEIDVEKEIGTNYRRKKNSQKIVEDKNSENYISKKRSRTKKIN
jgi:hypothetical protein